MQQSDEYMEQTTLRAMCPPVLASALTAHLLAQGSDPLVAESYGKLLESFGVTGASFLTRALDDFLDASYVNDELRRRVYELRKKLTPRFDDGTRVRTASGAVGRVEFTTAAKTCYVHLDGELVVVPQAELECSEVLISKTRVEVRDKGPASVLFNEDGQVGVMMLDENRTILVVPRWECAAEPPPPPTRTLWRAGAEPPHVDPHVAIGDSVEEKCFVVAFDTDRVVVYDPEADKNYLLPLGSAEPPPKRACRSSTSIGGVTFVRSSVPK